MPKGKLRYGKSRLRSERSARSSADRGRARTGNSVSGQRMDGYVWNAAPSLSCVGRRSPKLPPKVRARFVVSQLCRLDQAMPLAEELAHPLPACGGSNPLSPQAEKYLRRTL